MSNKITLKFEGFAPGDRIRVYDYDPSLIEGREVYAEGSIQSVKSAPFPSYEIHCDVCTGYGRVDKVFLVPMEVASNEFDGRIVKIS